MVQGTRQGDVVMSCPAPEPWEPSWPQPVVIRRQGADFIWQSLGPRPKRSVTPGQNPRLDRLPFPPAVKSPQPLQDFQSTAIERRLP